MYFGASVRYLLSEGPEYNDQRGSTAFCTQVVEWLVQLSGGTSTCNHTAVRKAICSSNIPRTSIYPNIAVSDWLSINPLPTNDAYNIMRHECTHFFHKPIKVYMGVNPLPTIGNNLNKQKSLYEILTPSIKAFI